MWRKRGWREHRLEGEALHFYNEEENKDVSF
jgi:hypothetical protein